MRIQAYDESMGTKKKLRLSRLLAFMKDREVSNANRPSQAVGQINQGDPRLQPTFSGGNVV
jgi:hypothetical protein